MSKSNELKIDRTLKAVNNAFRIGSTNPITLRKHIETLFEYRVVNSNMLKEWFTIAVTAKRVDLALVLVTSTNFEKMEFNKALNILFKIVCNIKADYLKILIDSDWFDFKDVNEITIKKILLCKLPYYFDPNRTWELMSKNDQDTLTYYKNNKLARDVMLLHKKGAELLLKMEEEYPEKLPYSFTRYYHIKNPKIVKMRKARWILALFYIRHLRNGIHNMLYEPGKGIRYKKSMESFKGQLGMIKNE